MARIRHFALPVVLLTMGVTLLIGCIPIPSLWQDQPDGKPRPEHFVGPGAEKPLRLGHTRIDDAFIILNRKITTRASAWGLYGTVLSRTSTPWAISNWVVSPDRRRFAVGYSVHAGTLIWPLCFTATQDTRQRWLTLDVDESGIVVRTETTKNRPLLHSPQPVEWLSIFDEATRRKLQAEGVFPSDELLKSAQQLREKSLAATRRSATRP